MRRYRNLPHPNDDQVGTDVRYEGEWHRITGVGGSYFSLVRLRDGYPHSALVNDVNGHNDRR
ncbi:hypothetical protein PV735_23160 [Streptomyces turgidiscabies]|uniref:Uncharacterized protein n=2 Tax=Streptomyces TaxID=1883 RepID=L7FC78_STRT8|nr:MULTISPECIES: hypothetical protein [Streptomyces]ELP69163.1 hypothetical protein STRTUCAR8_07482 [Streptomyces turgidiscabies Car8]MDX3495569.1 hypothetical protein [Streptomyces turgidiscabies]NEC89099.1 hypothetical protein [Streptomyces sp. SID12501]GAQ70258.1 hypothetical protein T45_01992 [Streptomyces turgidiscabies]